MKRKDEEMWGGVLPRFNRLHISFRLLFLVTCICLSIAYAFNVLQVWEVHGGNKNDVLGISPDSIRAAYYGKRDSSVLESKLRGSMAGFATEEEKNLIIGWIRNGSDEKQYHSEIAGIVERNCLTCHGEKAFRQLSSYEEIKRVTQIDTGMGLKTLVRVSHIHLNGLTFLFFISGFITCFSKMRSKNLKWVIIVAPMFAMLGDVLSWSIAREFEWGVYIVIISGSIMNLSFATQMVISVSQILLSFFEKDEGVS